jgi:predicted permease
MLETIFQDLRIGFRVLTKEKSFCALATFVLALGISGVTTQFAIVNGVLLHAFPFQGADRLVDIQLVDPSDFSPDNFNSQMLMQDYADMRENQQSFEYFSGYLNGSTVNLTYQGVPKRLTGGYVADDFFDALGVYPVLGREFLPEDNQPGVTKAVLLSDSLWQSDFGGDPNIVGKTVILNGAPGEIIGVMPPGFNFPINEQLWVPIHAEFPANPRNSMNPNFCAIMAKLKPGVSIDQAQAEITSFAQSFAEQYPDTNDQFSLGYVRPLINTFTGSFITRLLLIMLAFCLGVLLIACVNVMNMQFARATLRAKELAIRSSLGATRARLIRQMLTESLLLATIGAVFGISLSMWAIDLLDTLIHTSNGNQTPSWMHFQLDMKVMLAVVAATTFSALLSGFIPAWVSSRPNAVEVLKEGGRGNTSRSVMIISRGLVVFQIFITSVLLIGSLIQLQSIRNQQDVDHGYDTSAILGGRLGLMQGDYPDNESRKVFYESLLRELQSSGQFEAVALTNRFRMVFTGGGPIEIEGKKYLEDSDRENARVQNVSPGYFDVLSLGIIAGRDFTENDNDQDDPVTIVNEAFARNHFGNESPLGKRIRIINNNGTNPGPWRRIIGVVPTTRMQNPFNTESDGSGYYVPFFATAFGPVDETARAPRFGTIVVKPRMGQTPEALINVLQSQVNRVDPNLPMYFVETPEVSINAYLSQTRLIGTMFFFVGLGSVLLAAVGLYGIMSFAVNQRTQEFGVRMALGADNSRILGMVLKQAGWQLAIGLFLGIGVTLTIAYFAGEPLAGVFFGISPFDPATYVGVALLLTIVAGISSFMPALRATRVDPMIALRAE